MNFSPTPSSYLSHTIPSRSKKHKVVRISFNEDNAIVSHVEDLDGQIQYFVNGNDVLSEENRQLKSKHEQLIKDHQALICENEKLKAVLETKQEAPSSPISYKELIFSLEKPLPSSPSVKGRESSQVDIEEADTIIHIKKLDQSIEKFDTILERPEEKDVAQIKDSCSEITELSPQATIKRDPEFTKSTDTWLATEEEMLKAPHVWDRIQYPKCMATRKRPEPGERYLMTTQLEGHEKEYAELQESIKSDILKRASLEQGKNIDAENPEVCLGTEVDKSGYFNAGAGMETN